MASGEAPANKSAGDAGRIANDAGLGDRRRAAVRALANSGLGVKVAKWAGDEALRNTREEAECGDMGDMRTCFNEADAVSGLTPRSAGGAG